MTRIAITGIGVVSTFGLGRETFWDNVRRGVSGTRAITEFDATTYPCRVAAAVPPVSMDDAAMVAGETNGNGNCDEAADTPIRSATRAPRCSASSPRAKRGPTPSCRSVSRMPA